MRATLAALCALAIAVVVPAAAVAAERRSDDPAQRPAQPAALATRSLLLDIAAAGAQRVAVGERGHVLLSADAGQNWVQAASVPTQNLLTAVHFQDATRGWAVGHDEIILATNDGGRTWSRVHYAPERKQPLLDVWFADATSGIAVGAYSAYYTTSDGGRTWNAREFEPAEAAGAGRRGGAGEADQDEEGYEDFEPDYHLNRIVAVGDTLYIAAEAGQLYRSTDRGVTWQTLASPYEGSFYGLVALEGESLLAFGLRGNLFRTDDGGRSWASIETGTVAMLTDGARLDQNTVVISGLSGVLLISRDGGRTFALDQQADRQGIAAIVRGEPGTLITVGEGGVKLVQLGGAAR